MFAVLEWIPEVLVGAPAENLATDEALFRGLCGRPRLRVYRWGRPAASIGYFMRYRDVSGIAAGAGVPWLRRITGGGLVRHGEDLTVMLAIPCGDPIFGSSASTSYRAIHGVILEVLRSFGHQANAAVAPAGTAGKAVRRSLGGDCFTNPVAADLLGGGGTKIVGGAQRRTRDGLLYQGSVQIPRLIVDGGGFSRRLAEVFGGDIEPGLIDAPTRAAAVRLAEERYGSATWLKRR